MPSWALYVLVGLSVHIAVLMGLPESGIVRIAARFGIGADLTCVLGAMATLVALHRCALLIHQRSWRQGYFDGHVDGLEDAGGLNDLLGS